MSVTSSFHTIFYYNTLCLLFDDIPGSNLDLSRLTLYCVDQLKFWLSCRGDSLKNLPTKAACVQRYMVIYKFEFCLVYIFIQEAQHL